MTRNAILWIVIVGAVATYLGMMPDPRTWAWAQWCQTIAAVCAIAAAKLAPSPMDR